MPLGTPPRSSMNDSFLPAELMPMTRPSRAVVSPMTEEQAQVAAANALFATPSVPQQQLVYVSRPGVRAHPDGRRFVSGERTTGSDAYT